MCVGGDEWKIAVTVCIFFLLLLNARIHTHACGRCARSDTEQRGGGRLSVAEEEPVKLSTGYFK